VNATLVQPTGIMDWGIKEINDRLVVMPLPDAQALLNTSEISEYHVLLTGDASLDAARTRLIDKFKAAGVDVTVFRWSDRAAFYQQVKGVLGGFLVFIVIVAAPVEAPPTEAASSEAASSEAVSSEAVSSGVAYLQRRRAELRSRQEVAADQELLAEQLLRELVPATAATRRLAPQDQRLTGRAERMALNAAFLVDDDRSTEFFELVNELRARYPSFDVELDGPWPPYSFAVLDKP
jgi:hypothetical protein